MLQRLLPPVFAPFHFLYLSVNVNCIQMTFSLAEEDCRGRGVVASISLSHIKRSEKRGGRGFDPRRSQFVFSSFWVHFFFRPDLLHWTFETSCAVSVSNLVRVVTTLKRPSLTRGVDGTVQRHKRTTHVYTKFVQERI